MMSFDATAINSGAQCLCHLNGDVLLEGSVSFWKGSVRSPWHVV